MLRRWLLTLVLALVAHPGFAADQPITLTTATGVIRGSLWMPATGGKVPVALIVAGSGPTDRDGNNALIKGNNDSLKMLAVALAQAGVASVRYDKRGIGMSADAMVRESDLSLDSYVQDAVEWALLLNSDARFSGVAVIGHSEGALIGMVAAARNGMNHVLKQVPSDPARQRASYGDPTLPLDKELSEVLINFLHASFVAEARIIPSQRRGE